MKKLIIALGLLLALVSSAGVALAEEVKPAGMTPDDIKKALGMSIYLQGGYTYNFKNPGSQENGLRVFDHKANSFTFDLAQLVFLKDAPVGGVGYKLKLSAGETAKLIHSRGLGEANDAFDLTEAYIDYVAPLGKGLKLRFGKFVTMHGAEVIEAKDNFNYSRSFLFNYAIPFTHTGLMAGYTFSDLVSANFYVVNGWDNTDDNNKGKTVGLTLNLTPIEPVALAFNLMYGPEKDHNNSDNRFLFDFAGTFKPLKNTTVVINTDYATEEHSAADGGSAKWYGIAGYVKYDFSDIVSGTIRAEYFNDKNGLRTGTAQKLKEITITPEFKIAKSIIVRPEYRHDWSDKGSFDAGKKTQNTIALGVMYTW
ncbi:MAG: porin [Nitrospiraceae bacterium]|nr:porin [Nitrospiraceae bacterium]